MLWTNIIYIVLDLGDILVVEWGILWKYLFCLENVTMWYNIDGWQMDWYLS